MTPPKKTTVVRSFRGQLQRGFATFRTLLIQRWKRLRRYFANPYWGKNRRFLFFYAPFLLLGTLAALITLYFWPKAEIETAAIAPAAPPAPSVVDEAALAILREQEKNQRLAARFAEGQDALRSREFAEAESIFRELLAADAGNAASANNLAVALIAQKRHDDAAAVLAGILTRDPGNVGARANRAMALRAAGRLDEAIKELTVASEQDPLNALLANRLLLMRLQNGEITAVRETILARTKIGVPTLETGHIMAAAALAANDGDMTACMKALARAARILDTPTRRLLLEDPVFNPHLREILANSSK